MSQSPKMKDVFAEAEKKRDTRWRAHVNKPNDQEIPYETISDRFPGVSIKPDDGQRKWYERSGYKVVAPDRATLMQVIRAMLPDEKLKFELNNDRYIANDKGFITVSLKPPPVARANPPAVKQILDRVKAGERMTLRDMARLYARINNNPTKNPGYGDPLHSVRNNFLRKELDGTYTIRPGAEVKPPYTDRHSVTHLKQRRENSEKEQRESEAVARQLLAYLSVNPLSKRDIRKHFKQMLGYEPIEFEYFIRMFVENVLEPTPTGNKFKARYMEVPDGKKILDWWNHEEGWERANFRDE